MLREIKSSELVRDKHAKIIIKIRQSVQLVPPRKKKRILVPKYSLFEKAFKEMVKRNQFKNKPEKHILFI